MPIKMPYFDPHLSPLSIVLLSAACLCMLLMLAVMLPRLLRPLHRRRHLPHGVPEGATPLSVIVYARDDADNLRTLLPSILAQDYPLGFEVIVVNDGADEDTAMLVAQLQQRHPNLYITFTPEGARQLSRKKLALTVGIKAAHHPVVVLTRGDAEVMSANWLSHMGAPFADDAVEVVLGVAVWPRGGDRDKRRRRRALDYASTALTWLNSALRGRPWRGTGYNVAYRRDTFFANKGFGRSLNLRHGDDDIFIHEIARGDNTAVVLARDARIRIHPVKPRRMYAEMKADRAFSSRGLGRGPRLWMGLSSLLLWLWTGLGIAGLCVGLPNLMALALWGGMMLIGWGIYIWAWRRALYFMRARRLLFTLPWLLLTRPFYNLYYRLKGTRRSRRNYTWQ